MGKVYGLLAGALAALGILAAMLWRAMKAGGDSVKADQMEDTLEKVDKANRVRNSSDRDGVRRFDRK